LAATPQRRAGSLDLILPIEQVAEGYKAVDERSAIKTMLCVDGCRTGNMSRSFSGQP